MHPLARMSPESTELAAGKTTTRRKIPDRRYQIVTFMQEVCGLSWVVEGACEGVSGVGGAAAMRGRAARLVSGVRWCGGVQRKNWWVANVAVVVAHRPQSVLVSPL